MKWSRKKASVENMNDKNKCFNCGVELIVKNESKGRSGIMVGNLASFMDDMNAHAYACRNCGDRCCHGCLVLGQNSPKGVQSCPKCKGRGFDLVE